MGGNVYPLMARAVFPLLVLSLVSNLAILISPLFMMQLLDRVIPSGNTATLMLLAGLAFAALSLQAVVEACRDISLGRLSRWSEGEGTKMALSPNMQDQNKIITHVSGLTGFLAGPGALAALGAPWLPVFLLVLWALHPAFVGLVAVMSFLLWAIRSATDALSQASKAHAALCAEQEEKALQNARDLNARSGIAVLVHNMRLRFAEFQRQRHRYMDQSESAEVADQTATGFLRNAGQLSALGVGAWLVTADLMSAGGMIAGSIITSKAVMTVEALIRQFPAIRAAKDDYLALAAVAPPQAIPATMGDLSGALRAENIIFPRGGGAVPRLDRISFSLAPGECLAIVGRAGSGKSTLLQALCGIAPAPIGSVFLDENELRSLDNQTLFHVTGYLAQRVELNTGTIAESISCFDPSPDREAIIEATKMAGVHGLICALPDGFETNLEQHPYLLSAGQAQRVALARAIYTRPRYLFLDEPNALLDAEGERALGQTLMRLKSQGTTIVMILHRSGVMALADKVLKLEHGRVVDFGDKTEVLNRWGMGGRQLDLPLLMTSLPDLEDWIASQFTRKGDEELCHKVQILGTDLLGMACEDGTAEELRFGKFSFSFTDDTHCQLFMSVPAASGIDVDIAAVRDKASGGQSVPVHLSTQETRLMRLAQVSTDFSVMNEGDSTVFRLSVADEDMAPDMNLKRGAS